MDSVTPLRVVVAGALGRMGRATCAALADAPGIELVGRLGRTGDGASTGEDPFFTDPASCYDAVQPDVVVDFTRYPGTLGVVDEALARGISPVIGATGRSDAEERALAAACDVAGIGAALVPNFALGAVLMMRFAAEAARFFPTAEIVELHHDRKIDAPSGTARLTARRMSETSGREVPIHSVRLRGLVAHQEVLLGGDGELLTIRHDSLSRDSFMTGVLMAVRAVRLQRGLVVGLEPLMNAAAVW
jgi:4-hydroxy-tetrahydrodipicolinate reductase